MHACRQINGGLLNTLTAAGVKTYTTYLLNLLVAVVWLIFGYCGASLILFDRGFEVNLTGRGIYRFSCYLKCCSEFVDRPVEHGHPSPNLGNGFAGLV